MCSPYFYLIFSNVFFFFFNDTATTEIYTLSLHDALPISRRVDGHRHLPRHSHLQRGAGIARARPPAHHAAADGGGGAARAAAAQSEGGRAKQRHHAAPGSGRQAIPDRKSVV